MNKIKLFTALTGFKFHDDIAQYLYFGDSPLKNYEPPQDYFKDWGIVCVVGNINSGYNFLTNEEPSCLWTKLNIFKPPKWVEVSPVPKYPNYRSLNPYHRYEYLQYLCNPYVKTKDGYAFLLLYCLERRLSEGILDVIPIIIKLAEIQGGKFRQRVEQMFKNYARYKQGIIYPANTRVFCNPTLKFLCHYEILR